MENTIDNAKKFTNGCKHDGSFVPISEVMRLMVAYASKVEPRDGLVKFMQYFNQRHSGSTLWIEVADIDEFIEYLKK
jgi:hypothetical protein